MLPTFFVCCNRSFQFDEAFLQFAHHVSCIGTNFAGLTDIQLTPFGLFVPARSRMHFDDIIGVLLIFSTLVYRKTLALSALSRPSTRAKLHELKITSAVFRILLTNHPAHHERLPTEQERTRTNPAQERAPELSTILLGGWAPPLSC